MASVIVDTWSSRCSECGGNASQHEDRHMSGGPGGMWEPGSDLGSDNGCGMRFERAVDTNGRVLHLIRLEEAEAELGLLDGNGGGDRR